MKSANKSVVIVSKIILTVLGILSFFSVSFWAALYYVGGLSHLYYSQDVLNCVYYFFAIAILVLIILIAIIVIMFKSKRFIRIVCTILLIAFIPVALCGSFIEMIGLTILGPNGCSYTEDIANYGRYDYGYAPSFFPESITEDMTIVKYTYFYKYVDIDQIDIYLEVKFEDKETMDAYLTKAKNAISDRGVVEYQNPYDEDYTDVIGLRYRPKLMEWYADRNIIQFDGEEDYRYVEFHYSSICYSYSKLTIIYNSASIGSDIEIGNNPDKAEYYPQYLKRFGIEWDYGNNFDSNDVVGNIKG